MRVFDNSGTLTVDFPAPEQSGCMSRDNWFEGKWTSLVGQQERRQVVSVPPTPTKQTNKEGM